MTKLSEAKFKPNDFNYVAMRLAAKPAARLINLRAVSEGRCGFPTCGKKVEGFRDALSLREFTVSGMCQECQDAVFGTGE